MRDEGTVFFMSNAGNTATNGKVMNYFLANWWPNATEAYLKQIQTLYQNNQTAGLPFGTGDNNALYTLLKRISAVTGDYTFESLRQRLTSAAVAVPDGTAMLGEIKAATESMRMHWSRCPICGASTRATLR
ncbi:putative secreted lipase ARB_02369 [Colletotrichum liriopes]|uniref:Secreted lipase ARB_02369 n=1 Tax=Colletotrichum liriopes TaxID=708192 RepID=A0AA37LR24_9PEZI|nr:putative secreted lipase ARB_02369 [Colletotrichum liriopes]